MRVAMPMPKTEREAQAALKALNEMIVTLEKRLDELEFYYSLKFRRPSISATVMPDCRPWFNSHTVSLFQKNNVLKIPKSIQPLIDDGLVDEVIRSLMSGKEAQVFLVRCGNEVCR